MEQAALSGEIIVAEDISKTYSLGEVKIPALQGVSLTINKGDFLILTGRNGSGKSTLMHQLACLDLPDSGEIFINGVEVTRMPEEARTGIRLRDLGYVFQNYALIPELTVLENVMLPAMMLGTESGCKERVTELLAEVELEKLLNNLPTQLSGGEQQRVAIARCLVNNPMVIFADEPTANLDTKASEEVLMVFGRLNQEEKRTIVMVTHEPEETKYGNRIISLVDGKIT